MKYIIDFQRKNGLTPDGIIGKQTLIKMRCVFGIATDAQLAHFLANIHHETGGFSVAIENLHYSANRLARIWPTRYSINGRGVSPNTLAKTLANNPVKLANNVYSNRNGNGNEASGDGWKYRGAGAIQTTGRRNYQALANFVKDQKVMLGAEYVEANHFWNSALCYFTTGNLWNQMKYTDANAVKSVRKAVNGGYIGLEDVQNKFTYYYNLITK